MRNSIKFFWVISILLCINIILCSNKVVSADKPVWLSAENVYRASVKLGVFGKEDTPRSYIALFIINAPFGRQYKVTKTFPQDQDNYFGEWVYVTFPETFYAESQPGKYTWKCLIGGKTVAKGSFEYKSSSEVIITSPHCVASARKWDPSNKSQQPDEPVRRPARGR